MAAIYITLRHYFTTLPHPRLTEQLEYIVTPFGLVHWPGRRL